MIKAWLFSFMKSECEPKDEYNISKIFLLHYVDSKFLKKTIGDISARTIILYLRTYFSCMKISLFFIKEEMFDILMNTPIHVAKVQTMLSRIHHLDQNQT